MSMNQDTEQFEQLRRLLALKRHEQPPPGYFNGFSRQVIVRIKAGERGEQDNLVERLFEVAPWLQRVWAAFEARPAVAGALGLAMCGLFGAGVLVYSDKPDATPMALVPAMETPATVEARVALTDHPLFIKPAAFEASSTSPITTSQTDELLLHGIANLRPTLTTLRFSAGN